jgi:hypothetical protein
LPVRSVGLLAMAVLVFCARATFAQTLTTAGTPGLMRVSSAVAGSEPLPITVAGGTYTVVTLNPNRTYAITAQLNSNMPTGSTMAVMLVAPAGATSLGAVALDVTARNVVTGIGRNVNSTQNITYTFTATAAAGVVPLTSRTVTLTVIRFP